MLDRFSTELIMLIIDATSTSAWDRKDLIDSLSLVCTSYRTAMRPLRESVVHVPRADVIPLLRSWPAATRKAVDTVFVGTDDQAKAVEPFSLRDFSRLFSILPNIEYVYLQRVGGQYEYKKRFLPCRMLFELNSYNPFKRASFILGLWKSQRLLTSTSQSRMPLALPSQLELDFLADSRHPPLSVVSITARARLGRARRNDR